MNRADYSSSRKPSKEGSRGGLACHPVAGPEVPYCLGESSDSVSGITEGQGQSGPRRFFCFSPRGLYFNQARSWVSWDHTPWTALYSLPSASDRSLLLLKAPDKSRTRELFLAQKEPSTYCLQGFLELTCCGHFRHPRPCSLPAGGTHVENCYRSSGPVHMSGFLSLLTQRFLRECTLFFQVSRATGKVMPNTAQG